MSRWSEEPSPPAVTSEEIQPLSGAEKTTARCSITPAIMKNLRLGCFVGLGLGCVYIWLFVNVSDSTKHFLAWIKIHRLLGIILLSLTIVVGSILMMPVTPLILGAGFSLGVTYGQVAVSLGCTIGAHLAFYVARRLLRDWVEESVLPRFPMLLSLDGVIAQKKRALQVCLLIRMCPIFPFAMLNYSLGTTSLEWKPHLIGTAVGMFPEQLMIVYLGSQLRDVNDVVNGEAEMMKHGGGSSVGTWIVLVLLVVFTLVGTMYSHRELRNLALQYECERSVQVDAGDDPLGEESNLLRVADSELNAEGS